MNRAGHNRVIVMLMESQMPICPTCKVEFGEGTERCPKCGLPLVTDLPFPDEQADLVEIYIAADKLEADLILNILGDDAIHAMARSLQDSMFPTHTNIQSGVRIAVPQRQADHARQVIRQARADGAVPESGVFL